MGKELLTESLQVAMTPSQMKKLERLAQREVLMTGTYARRHLVKTLKLKDDS